MFDIDPDSFLVFLFIIGPLPIWNMSLMSFLIQQHEMEIGNGSNETTKEFLHHGLFNMHTIIINFPHTMLSLEKFKAIDFTIFDELNSKSKKISLLIIDSICIDGYGSLSENID